MRRHAARIIGLVTGLFSIMILSACAGTQTQNTQDGSQSESATQSTQANAAEEAKPESAAEKIQDAAQATIRETAEAAEVVGRTLTGTKEPEAQQNAKEQRAKNLGQVQGAAQSVGIGGGPVDSETIAILDSVDAATQRYETPIDTAGDTISPATRLRFEQVRDGAKDLREQYDTMATESDMDPAELDAQYKASAEQLQESWDDVAQNLRRELDEAASEEENP